MPYRANYPATVAEILSDRITYRPAALRAVRKLRKAKAWRGTMAHRLELFRTCARELAEAYGLPRPNVRRGVVDCYVPSANTIRLAKLSVVTLLHEFAHARGYDERQAVRWSVNLFRRLFPRSYARCQHVGHMLVATGRHD